MEALVFYVVSFLMVVSSVLVIINRNPVASALSLVLAFVLLAVLFVTLEAFFLAAVQILVYAGAVMVLFLFIIMLLDLKAEKRRKVNRLAVWAGMLITVLFTLLLTKVIQQVPSHILTFTAESDDVYALGKALFSQYLLPFEITSLILLAALIGVVHVSRKEVRK